MTGGDTARSEAGPMGTPADLWVSSGHHLLDRDAQGRLRITDQFLKAYLARPEIVPPPEACDAERRLHDRLLAAPRAPVPTEEIRGLADRDARENWRQLLALRAQLLAQSSIEAAYLALVGGRHVTTPPLLLNQLVHLIARNLLDGETDPYLWRAAELLFRPQRLTLQDGVMLLADEERVDGSEVPDRTSPLVAIFGDARARALDVMTPDTVALYPARSDAFDMVLDFRSGQPGRSAFARVIARWVEHMLGTHLEVAPVERYEADGWSWFVGLDAEGTRIGNALWAGEEPPDDGQNRIVALLEARLADAAQGLDRVAGRPFPLILAMTANRIVRVKPQNLLTGLPLRQLSSPP